MLLAPKAYKKKVGRINGIVDTYLGNSDLKNSIFNTMIGSNFPLGRELNQATMDDLSYAASKM